MTALEKSQNWLTERETLEENKREHDLGGNKVLLG